MNDHRPSGQRNRRRAAFTMIELMISLSIFMVVMTLVMNSLTSMTSYSTQESNQDDMVIQGREAVRLITNDVANSSLLYDFDQTLSQMIFTLVPNSVGYVPPTPYQSNPLLPWVWIDGVRSNGTIDPAVSNSTVTTSSSGVTTTTTYGNPAWEKDTFEYLKLRTSDLVRYSPNDERYEVLNQAVASVSTLDTFATAPATQFLIVNDNYPAAAGPNDIFVSHVWEAGLTGTRSSPNAFSSLTFNQNQNPAFLRHYHLEVINAAVHSDNPAINTGTLVRRYWNGDGSTNPGYGNDSVTTSTGPSWNPDDQQILLYNVQSFVVRTQYQPLPNATLLQPNQVSITIVIQDPGPSPGVYIPQTISFITAMRSMAQ